MAIPLFLGKDVAGDPIVEDLARMPHFLIAGTTGSGKSVCINAILLSILMTRTPAQVRLILIDPKMVELQHYCRVPHLSCEVVSNMKKAPGVLEWCVEEMERRYALLKAAGVNHIVSYNKLGAEELERRLQRPADQIEVKLPYQVLVIDELADLMNVSRNEVEESVQRLAQKSRAVGLHVIIAHPATQHRRDHRRDQGQPALPGRLQGQPQDRFAGDPRQQRRREVAGPRRHAVRPAGR